MRFMGGGRGVRGYWLEDCLVVREIKWFVVGKFLWCFYWRSECFVRTTIIKCLRIIR